MTGDDLGFTIAFPTPTATRLPKSSNVIPEGTVSARTELATTKTDRSNPSVAATTRQNFRSLAVGSIWHLTPKHSGDLGVATKEPRKGRPAATGRVLLRLVKWP